jgi:hypothetical protein
MAELVAYGEGDCLEAVGRGERRASWLADDMSALPMCLRGALCAGQLDGGAAESGVHEALEPALAALCWREAYTSDEVDFPHFLIHARASPPPFLTSAVFPIFI